MSPRTRWLEPIWSLEADLASSLARAWNAPADFPPLHLPFDRLLASTPAAAWTVTTAPEGPDVATVTSMGVAVAAGDPERVVRQLAELQADGYRVVVAADSEGSAARIRELLQAHGVRPEVGRASCRERVSKQV